MKLEDFYNLYVSQPKGIVRDYLIFSGIGVWELYSCGCVKVEDAETAIGEGFSRDSLSDYPFRRSLSSPDAFSELVSGLERGGNFTVNRYSDNLVTVDNTGFEGRVSVYYLDKVSERTEDNPVMEGLYTHLIESDYALDSKLFNYFIENGVTLYKHNIYECVGGSVDDIESAIPESVPFISYYISYEGWLANLEEVRGSEGVIISDDGLSYRLCDTSFNKLVIELSELEVFSSK